MNISAKKVMSRGVVGAALVATVGIGAAACSSDEPGDDLDIETPIDDVGEVPEEAPDDGG